MKCLVLGSSSFVPRALLLVLLGCFVVPSRVFSQQPVAKEEIFRPEAGKFPPLEKSRAYRGVLAFVDHANRRGSLRVETTGEFFRNPPHPFALLPYGMVRRHGAPADLRDIPLGAALHVRAF